MGPQEQAATERTIRTAIGRAVDEARDQGLDRDMVNHVLLMFERLFIGHYHNDASVITKMDDEAALLYWRQAAEAAGWDIATFPLHFPQVVGRILSYLPMELRAEASNSESPLFNRITVTALTDLESRLSEVLKISSMALSCVIPIAEPLHRTLNGARQTARTTGRAFVTPHMLLALLQQRDSLTRDALDYTRQGLAREIYESLTAYLANASLGRFADFDWRERDDVRAAQVAAARKGSLVITEGYLLVGILETPSNTQRQLVAWLGPKLINNAKKSALVLNSSARVSTPGVVFPPAVLGPDRDR
jgi:hypothetical protein